MSRGGCENSYGRGYIVALLGDQNTPDFRNLTKHVRNFSRAFQTERASSPHITFATIGRTSVDEVDKVGEAIQKSIEELPDVSLEVGGFRLLQDRVAWGRDMCVALAVNLKQDARQVQACLNNRLRQFQTVSMSEPDLHMSVARVSPMAIKAINGNMGKVEHLLDEVSWPFPIKGFELWLSYGTGNLSSRSISFRHPIED
jgi:hypothetical protein